MNEQDILCQVRDWLRIHGWFVRRNHQSLGSHKGTPDLSCFGPKGLFMELEIKTEAGKLSKHQLLYQDEMEHRGHKYYVVRSLEDIIKILDELRDL